jgi:hypothetical protein
LNAPGAELSGHIPYHSPMRHLLFAVLIALLLLRGWVGDAMATQMAAGQLQHQATQVAAEAGHLHEDVEMAHTGHGTEAPALHDCAEQPADSGNSQSADGHCETCAACQACHTVALSPAAPGAMPHFSALALPRPAADSFASADASLRQKPPIS